MPSVTRALFVAISAVAIGILVAGTGCTRRGGNGMVPSPTATPIATYYVNPISGSDSNNGTSSTTPFKTLTKALAVVGKSTSTGLTISLAAGTYSSASGEIFPLVVPVGVIVMGNNYGRAASKGAFIKGFGEDTTLEKVLGKPTHTYYATMVIPTKVSAVSIDRTYLGSGYLALPAGAQYASLDDLGSVSASQTTFGVITASGKVAGGVLVPSGTFSCSECNIGGFSFGIEAFSVSSSSSSSSSSSGKAGPTLILSGPGQSIIGGSDGIRTDGSASITASNQSFQSRVDAYDDSLAPAASIPAATTPSPSPSGSPLPSPGVIDFGYGPNGSLGGNTFIGSNTEMSVLLPDSTIYAFNNTWNANVQHSNAHGRYATPRTFRAGSTGQNVTVSSAAGTAAVYVGPAPPPSPSPSPTTSTSPSPSPT